MIPLDKLRLEQLKDKYWNVYKTETSDGTFIWRELSRGEWSKSMRYFPDEYEREEYICKLCVIEPDMSDFDFDNCKAGVISTLIEDIFIESGFSSDPNGKIDTLINKYTKEMNDFQHQISCIIVEAFQYLDLEEIENWPLEKTIWYYSRALYILESLRGLELIQSEDNDTVDSTGMQITSGDASDFPELAQQRAFMKGKGI